MVSIKLQFQVKGSPFPPPSEDGSIHGEDSVRLTMSDVDMLALVNEFIGNTVYEEGLENDPEIKAMLAGWEKIEQKVEKACSK